MSHFHGAISGTHLHGNGSVPTGSSGVPNEPADVESSATGGTTATLTLTDATGGSATHRWQLRALPSGTWFDAAGATNPSPAGVATFAATGLEPATQYDLQARAEDVGGNSAYTAGTAFWTDNTGSGGGEIPLPTPFVLAAPSTAPRVQTSSRQVQQVRRRTPYQGRTR